MADAGRKLAAGDSSQVEFADGETQSYFLPLALAWEDSDGERHAGTAHCTLAQVRQHARVGIVYDAFWDRAFCRSIVKAMGSDLVLAGARRQACVHPHRRIRRGGRRSKCRRPGIRRSSRAISMVILDEKLVLKGYRRLRQGINPEIEIGRYLTDVSPFPHIAPVLGALQFCDEAGRPTTLAVLQQYVQNQGSGWNYVIEYLRRYLDQQLTLAPDEVDAAAAAAARRLPKGRPPLRLPASAEPDRHARAARPRACRGCRDDQRGAPTPHASFLTLVAMLGQRTGELHVALAATSGDPAFDPEPVSTDDVAAWIAAVVAEVDQTFDQLSRPPGRPSAAGARGSRATARDARRA